MRIVIIGLVIVAVILAGGTAFLLRDYISTQQAEIAAQIPKAPTVKVLVAASDMPVGTVVNENNTEWIDWPKDDVPEGFMAKTEEANPIAELTKEKHLARRGFVKGEPITQARLYKNDNPGFLRGSLTPGMRAVAVRTSAEIAAGGFILPEDKVDVVLSHDITKATQNAQGGDIGGARAVSETIITDVRVLAVDQKTNQFEGGAAVGKTILLEVTPKQAEMLSTARDMGTVSLSLRSAEEGDARTDPPYTTDVEVSHVLSALTGAAPRAGASSQADAPMPMMPSYTPSPPSPKNDLTIYRGLQPGANQ